VPEEERTEDIPYLESGPKITTSISIPQRMHTWLKAHGIKLSFVVYKGFEWLKQQRELNAKLQEMQKSIEAKIEAIGALNSRILTIYKNFEEIKKRYNLPDDVKLE